VENRRLHDRRPHEKRGDRDHDSYTFWGPGAGDSMRDRVHSILDSGRKLTAALEDACTTLEAHRGHLQDAVDVAVMAIRATMSAGFTVADDGMVTPPPAVPDPGHPSGSMIIEQAVALQSKADEFTRIITRHLDQVGVADDRAAVALTEILTDVQKAVGLDPVLGEAYRSLAVADAVADGIAVRNGPLEPEDYNRICTILEASRLSPAQLEALARGETVEGVPTVVMDYLRDFYREAGSDGLLNLAEALRSREQAGDPHAAAQLDALANGLLTISNDNVGDGWVGGSYDLLPDDLRDTLSRINSHSLGPTYDALHDVTTAYNEGRIPEVAALLAEANPTFVPGVEFATELDRAVSSMVDVSTPSGSATLFDTTATKFLEIGTRNEAASYELLTTPGNARILIPLLEHDWGDGGVTAGRLVDWIARDAVVTDPDNSTRADRAGEAAHSLATLMSSSGSETPLAFTDPTNTNPYDRLMNIPGVGDGKSSLGEMNPALAQSIASSLSPYVIDMVTSDRTLSTTSNFGQLGPVETTRLFSILDGDPHAGTLISGHALAAADEIDRAFARSDREPPPIMLGETSGRLRAAVEGGLDIEIGDRVNDLDERKAERATTRAGFFGAAQAIGAGAVSYLPPPWGVAASTGTYVAGSFLSSDIIDADGNLTNEFALSPQARFRLGAGESGTPDQTQVTDNEISYIMFSELAASGRVSGIELPEYLWRDERLATYAEITDGEESHSAELDRLGSAARRGIVEYMPGIFDDAGLRSVDGYLHQHSIAVNSYRDMIFGHASPQDSFGTTIRGSGDPTSMSRWPA